MNWELRIGGKRELRIIQPAPHLTGNAIKVIYDVITNWEDRIERARYERYY